jgi:dCTP deaminase
MAILCDTQIQELIDIRPFEKAQKRPGRISYGVSSYGYDIRVGTRFKIFTPTPRTGGVSIVDPKAFDDDLFVEVDTTANGRDHVIIPRDRYRDQREHPRDRPPRDRGQGMWACRRWARANRPIPSR